MDYIDFALDDKLNDVRKQNGENINEFDIDPTDPRLLILSGGISTGIVVGGLVQFLWLSFLFKRSIKVDKVLSQRVNDILKSGNKWKTHQYPDRIPNAFAIGGNDIFVTTGLVKLLDEREVDAVMLHEAWHNKDLHIWKKIAYDSSLTYLIIYTAMLATTLTMIPIVTGFIVAFTLRNMSNIVYARTMGRRHENAADEYAIKLGYGPELASSLEKMEDWAKRKFGSRPCNRTCQIINKISEAIDEHPPIKARIETILKKSKELDRAMSGGLKSLSKFVVGVFKNNG